MTRRLKRSVVYSLYVVGFLGIMVGIFLLSKTVAYKDSDEHQFVSKTGIRKKIEDVPVVTTETKIIKPYIEGGVELTKKYYDYKDTEENQESAITYYEGTYMPNNGVIFTKEEAFDVVAILDGKVEEVKEDENVGNMITIKHDNGIVSVYESVKDIEVKQGDSVAQGQKLGVSNTSNLRKDLNNHLYFELKVNDKTVNPEQYFNKKVSEIGA